MTLRIQEAKFPDGSVYGVFFLRESEIGRAFKADEGWVVFQKRKVMPTAEMAAKVMIDDRLNRIRRDEEFTRGLLEVLRLHCGGKLPNNSKTTKEPAT